MWVSGFSADWIKTKGFLSMKNIRKLYVCIPHMLDAALLIAVAFTPNPITCVALITLAVALGAFSSSGLRIS